MKDPAVTEEVNKFKVEAFYHLKKFLNLDYPDPNSKPWEQADDEPFLDEEDETYISLVLDELVHKVKLTCTIQYNKQLIDNWTKEKEEAEKDMERAIQNLERLGYKREEIVKKLKEDMHD